MKISDIFGVWSTLICYLEDLLKKANNTVVNLLEPRGREMKDLVHNIVKSLVDHPDQIEISEVKGDLTSVIELMVDKKDIGKVIGKQGRTAQAIRTILKAASAKSRKRVLFEILD